MTPEEIEPFLGTSLLMGVTYLDSSEQLIEQKQMFGTIERINDNEGIVVRLDSGDEFKLPPLLKSLQPAPKGEFRLRSTGQIVIDPDFLTTWTSTKSADS